MEYSFYFYARILKRKLSEIVDSGFMTGRGTVDAVFILRRLREKYWSKGKKLFSYSVCVYTYIYIYIYSVSIKMSYRVDVLLHRPALHPIFSYFLRDLSS